MRALAMAAMLIAGTTKWMIDQIVYAMPSPSVASHAALMMRSRL